MFLIFFIYLFIDCPPGLWGRDCSKKCVCQNNGVCDQYNGMCKCPKGYIGDKCELECPVGRYGLNCTETCRCENSGNCHHISGECTCEPGFTGPLCNETCPDGKHGSACQQECKCQNNGKCNPQNGECECPPGTNINNMEINKMSSSVNIFLQIFQDGRVKYAPIVVKLDIMAKIVPKYVNVSTADTAITSLVNVNVLLVSWEANVWIFVPVICLVSIVRKHVVA